MAIDFVPIDGNKKKSKIDFVPLDSQATQQPQQEQQAQPFQRPPQMQPVGDKVIGQDPFVAIPNAVGQAGAALETGMGNAAEFMGKHGVPAHVSAALTTLPASAGEMFNSGEKVITSIGGEGLANIPLVRTAEERIGQASAGILRKAKELGIPLSVTDITRSPAWAKIEGTLAKTPLGAKVFEMQKERQIQAAKAALEKMAEKHGASQELYSMGENLKSAIASQSTEKYAKANELYDAVGAMVDPKTVVPTPALQKAAKAMLDEHNLLKPSMQDVQVKAVLGDFAKDPGSSWNALRVARSQMIKEIAENDAGIKLGIKGQSNATAGIYKRLLAPLNEDTKRFGEMSGGKVNNAIELANSFYGGLKGRFSSDAIRTIAKNNPEDIAGFILRPNNITEIAALKKAVGPESFKQVKRSFFDKLLTAGKGGEFSPQAMNSTLSKFGDPTLKEIFSKQELSDLKEFSRITSMMGSAEKMASNNSGTGQYVITALGGGLMVKSPIAGVVFFLAPGPMAKMMSSDVTRKILLDGLKTPVQSGQAAAVAATLIRISTSKQFQDKPKNVGTK